jgi:hypothetical protein
VPPLSECGPGNPATQASYSGISGLFVGFDPL